MKNIKRLLAVLLVCTVVLAAFPSVFFLSGAQASSIELKTLENFTANSLECSVNTGATLTVVGDIGAVGGGKALKINPSGLKDWDKAKVTIPLNDVTVGSAKGILIYTEWLDHPNFHVYLKSQTDGEEIISSPIIYNQPPLYDSIANKWITKEASGNEAVIKLPNNFEGYVYVPFAELDNSLNSSSVLKSIEIHAFDTGTSTSFSIGSIYLVENNVLPIIYSGTAELPSDVMLDGKAASLYRMIQLATIDGFTAGIEKYSVTPGALLSIIENTGVIGSGKALKLDATALGYWSKAHINIPLSLTVANSRGLLVYVKWVDNTNFFVSLEGKSGDTVSKWTFAQWNSKIPLYDVVQDKWIGSSESNNSGAISVPSYFEGYVYIPFGKIFNNLADTNKITLSNLKIETFRTEKAGEIIIGGVFLAENDSIPNAYAEGIDSNVVLDGGEPCSLSNKPMDASAIVTGYTEKLDSLKIDGLFYKQGDLDAVKSKLSALKTALESAETKQEQEALIAEFEVDFQKFMDGPKADFSVATMSDPHLRASGGNLTRLKKFLNDVKTASPDAKAVLIAGDLTENGSSEEFERYWDTIGNNTPEGTVVLSAMGNHDARGSLASTESKSVRWNKAKALYLDGLNNYLGTEYTDTYYHQVIGGYDFIVLNTEDADKDTATITAKQQEWFKEKLEDISADKPNKPIFVMLHQPLTATHPETTVLESTVGASGKALKNIVADYPQVIFISGHIHNGVGYSDIINDGKGIYLDLPSSEANSRGNTSLTLVYYISIHGNLVRFRVRDFQTGEWLNEYEHITPLTGVTVTDKDELRKAYYLYRSTGQGRYSEETWNTFLAALESAHSVLNDTTVSQLVVDDALNALNKAVEGLETEPLDLAAGKEAMSLEILQDFAEFDVSGVANGSDKAASAIQNGSSAIDSVNSLILSSGKTSDSSARYTVEFKNGAELANAQGILAYIKLPTGMAGSMYVNVDFALMCSDGEIDLSAAKVTYLDNTSQTWFILSPSITGGYTFPTGFEGYVRISFEGLSDEQKTKVEKVKAVSFKCENIGSNKNMVIGGIYAVLKDTAGITAVLGNKTERYIVNGMEVTEEQKTLYDASMKAETLQSFKGYAKGQNALGDVVDITGAQKNDITVTFKDSINSILNGNALEVDAESMHSYWPGDDVKEEWAYITAKYPANTYMDDMAAFMFYIEVPQPNPYSENPFETKVFFNLHTEGANQSVVWSDTASYETLYFLEEGSTEWQRIESDTGHIVLPAGSKGYVMAPIDSFTKNPISTSLDGRRLIDTTFIISGFGGDMGAAVIDGIWSVMDMGTNNLLMSYNGAQVWNLSNGKAAVKGDLDSGTQFPEEEKLLTELPETTVSDYEIYEPDWDEITDTTVILSWDAFPDAKSYLVQIYKTVFSNTGIKYKVVSEKTVAETSAVMNSLESLSWYYAVVQALDADGDVIAIYPNMLFQSADSEDDYFDDDFYYDGNDVGSEEDYFDGDFNYNDTEADSEDNYSNDDSNVDGSGVDYEDNNSDGDSNDDNKVGSKSPVAEEGTYIYAYIIFIVSAVALVLIILICYKTVRKRKKAKEEKT